MIGGSFGTSWRARTSSSSTTVTFDRKAAKLPGMRVLE
jgi:hypothetical protein